MLAWAWLRLRVVEGRNTVQSHKLPQPWNGRGMVLAWLSHKHNPIQRTFLATSNRRQCNPPLLPCLQSTGLCQHQTFSMLLKFSLRHKGNSFDLLIFEGGETEETHWPHLLTEKGNGFRKQIMHNLYLNREVNMYSTNFDAIVVCHCTTIHTYTWKCTINGFHFSPRNTFNSLEKKARKIHKTRGVRKRLKIRFICKSFWQ